MHHPVSVLNSSMPEGRCTVVIFGLYRGGTSMIAGLARVLGVFMGDRIDPANHEDLDLQGADGLSLRNLIRKRNAEHDVWGWKDPGISRSSRDLTPILRNPRYIVTFRDILASSQTEVHGGFLPDIPTALRIAQEQMGRIVDFVAMGQTEKTPTMLVSYERALGQPEMLVQAMTQFLGISLNEQTRQAALRFIDPLRGYGWPDQTVTRDSVSTLGSASM